MRGRRADDRSRRGGHPLAVMLFAASRHAKANRQAVTDRPDAVCCRSGIGRSSVARCARRVSCPTAHFQTQPDRSPQDDTRAEGGGSIDARRPHPGGSDGYDWQPMSTPATVRSRVRLALDRAWAAAEAAGTLPAHPADAPRPSVEIERPAKPEHGDLATNLAMQLARPLRRPPLAIATAIVEALATSATDPASPIAEATVASPGFINLRLSDGLLAETRSTPSSPVRTTGAGRTATRPRVVNVEFVSANPTGPLHDRQRARRVRRRPARAASSRPAASSVTREYYFNDSGGQIERSARRSLATLRGRADPRGRLPRATTSPISRRPCRTTSGRRRRPTAPTRTGSSAAGRRSRSGRASRPASSALGVHFDVWKSEGSLHADGWVDAGDRAAPRARPPVRAGRRDVVPLDRRSATTRTGSSSARTASRPTSPPTSATSPRSSAAASTT